MNLKDLLDEYSIEYWTDGKNVSKGWTNVQCPYCDDESNHCGIRNSDLKVNCWKCGRHNILNLVVTITGIPYSEAKNLKLYLSRAGDGINPPSHDDPKAVLANYVCLPPESTMHFPKSHRRYLKERGFSSTRIIRKYKLRAVHTIGEYKFRIIIPIYMDNKLVSFTSRDITDQQEPKYLHSRIKQSIIDPKNAIYNYDSVTPGTDAFLMEGPIDTWKMGDGALGSFGVQLTDRQLIYLKRKKIRKMFLFLDGDKEGRKAAKRLSFVLAPLVQVLEILTIDKDQDPGNLSIAEAESLKHELGFNR